MNPQKELLWGLWVVSISEIVLAALMGPGLQFMFGFETSGGQRTLVRTPVHERTPKTPNGVPSEVARTRRFESLKA